MKKSLLLLPPTGQLVHAAKDAHMWCGALRGNLPSHEHVTTFWDKTTCGKCQDNAYAPASKMFEARYDPDFKSVLEEWDE